MVRGKNLLGFTILLTGSFALCAPVPAPVPVVTDAQIVNSLNRAIDCMLKLKKADGTWEQAILFETTKEGEDHAQRFRGGATALAVYALLNAGMSLDDPRLTPRAPDMAPAIKYLMELKNDANYVAAFQASSLVIASGTKAETRAILERCKAVLLGCMRTDGSVGYTMHSLTTGNHSDNSNTQYNNLAIWYLGDAGIEVPLAYWKTVDNYWRRTQMRDGGWYYSLTSKESWHSESSISMTLAGLASLSIAQDFVAGNLTNTPVEDRNMTAGMKYLDDNVSVHNIVTQHSSRAWGLIYSLYGMERVGLAAGRKYIGNRNWFVDGANYLLKQQNPKTGGWEETYWSGTRLEKNELYGTAYAMMFMARGRNPVVFNKLEYNGPWNARPRDNANVTSALIKAYERPINWQTVNLNVDPADWLDAPYLMITGSRDPKFTPADLAKLRAYVAAGGIIFSTADGGAVEFTNAMRSYANKLFDGKYEMRALDKDDLLFSVEHKITTLPQTLAASNGIRHFWIHSAADLGATWQMRRFATKAHYEFPANLFFYATGKGSLRTKLNSLFVPETKTAPRLTIPLARIEFSGNWQPEEGAWPRLARLMKRDHAVDLQLSVAKLAQLDASKTPLAHLTAPGALPFEAQDRAQLKAYLDAGGTLIADAAGGAEEFGATIVDQLKLIYPDLTIDRIQANDPILAGGVHEAPKITTIQYRKYAQLKRPSDENARLLLAKQGNRVVAIISGDDLTSGLLGTGTWGNIGYTPDTSYALMRNILLTYAPKGATSKAK